MIQFGILGPLEVVVAGEPGGGQMSIAEIVDFALRSYREDHE